MDDARSRRSSAFKLAARGWIGSRGSGAPVMQANGAGKIKTHQLPSPVCIERCSGHVHFPGLQRAGGVYLKATTESESMAVHVYVALHHKIIHIPMHRWLSRIAIRAGHSPLSPHTSA